VDGICRVNEILAIIVVGRDIAAILKEMDSKARDYPNKGEPRASMI
jgi:hypothetical protein